MREIDRVFFGGGELQNSGNQEVFNVNSLFFN